MVGSLADLKKTLYRKVKYRLRKPQPPTIPVPFSGPVLVVGSAPISNKPADFDASFRVITINGSQATTAAWGVSAPDVTLVQFNQIEGTTTNAVHVRRVLAGQKTGRLYVLLWRKEQRQRLIDGLKAFDYQYAELEIVDKYERMALLDQVVGLKSCELDADSKCSNGVNAVLFALHNGATAVIMTGINPASGGHSYNQENLARQHVQMDKQVLQTLLHQGYPLYTTDPAVSDLVGIPLWKGIGTIGANGACCEGFRED
jgi:hypothetical protein